MVDISPAHKLSTICQQIEHNNAWMTYVYANTKSHTISVKVKWNGDGLQTALEL